MEDGQIGATEYAGGNGTRKRGGMRNVYCRGERLGLSLCAVPSPRGMWGLSIYGRDKGLQIGRASCRERVCMLV